MRTACLCSCCSWAAASGTSIEASALRYWPNCGPSFFPETACYFGFDLEKSKTRLIKAYDDPTGVTAAFNRNVLGRVNRELGSDFDLASFAHSARYDECNRRVEMHLVARRSQRVRIPGARGVCRLGRGDTIWTESSYKFSVREVREMMEEAGFAQIEHWIERRMAVAGGAVDRPRMMARP